MFDIKTVGKIILAVLLILLLMFAWHKMGDVFHKPTPPPQVIMQPPTAVKAEDKTEVKVVYVPQPANDPAKVKVNVNPADFIVSGNGQQISVKGLAGETKPLENGQLGFNVQSTVKVDVSEMIRNEVVAAVNKQAEEDAKILKKEKAARARDRVIGGVIIGLLGYKALD